jgi:hypothetical protein
LVASTLIILFSEMLKLSQTIFFKEEIIVYTPMTHHSYPSIREEMQNYLSFEIMNIYIVGVWNNIQQYFMQSTLKWIGMNNAKHMVGI